MSLDLESAPTGTDVTTQAITGQHIGALDGLRAFALAGVVAYHLGLGWAKGGYLGVDLFFVLSGFLITSLLVEERIHEGHIVLANFWARRARRLLPALFVVLVAIGIFVVCNGRFGAPGAGAQIDLSGLRGDALATLFYVANWHAIFAHQSYFAQFASPSPLEHTWSLAIEEQFYVLWPLVIVALWRFVKGNQRRVLTIICVLGAAASLIEMAVLYHPGSDPTRVYFGTDTRAFELLLGAALASVTAGRSQLGASRRRWLTPVSALAGAGLLAMWAVAGTAGGLPPSWMFEGGFALAGVLAVTVVTDARQLQPSALGRFLSLAPLRALGRISYGVYLWHWPVIVYCTEARTGLSGIGLDVVRIVITLAGATLSYWLIEQPVRRRRWRDWRRFAAAPLAAAVVAGVIVVSTVPAIAAPVTEAPSARVTANDTVPGIGGFGHEIPIKLAPGRVLSHQDPLRVMLLGDSVMSVASLGIEASLEATGKVTVVTRAIGGFGLINDPSWPTGFPQLISEIKPELIICTWSWDDADALDHPSAYAAELARAIKTFLAPGDGVDGVIFLEFPPFGPYLQIQPSLTAEATRTRDRGQVAWRHITETMVGKFPGQVMYLPIAPSVLDKGAFSAWLPPINDPKAPRRQWVRVRMTDNVHLCPAGVVRYSTALLADMRYLFHLPAAVGDWSQADWIHNARYNTPPGSCPDDHPPS